MDPGLCLCICEVPALPFTGNDSLSLMSLTSPKRFFDPAPGNFWEIRRLPESLGFWANWVASAVGSFGKCRVLNYVILAV